MDADQIFTLSGERFEVSYRLGGAYDDAHARAVDICYEQTVEFPPDLTPRYIVEGGFPGRIERFEPHPTGGFTAIISYPVEISGPELTQWVNVLFGNISLKEAIRVEDFQLPSRFSAFFKGPRFGRRRLRELLQVPVRPLLCAAIKPMGMPMKNIAELAYNFAIGGIDIIKDDHGLSDQVFCRFHERVERCVEAVERANARMGIRSIYVANISAPHHQILERAVAARRAGAGGLMIGPGLVGFDTIKYLAEMDELALPIFSHPTFQGSYVLHADQGISHRVLFGKLPRLAGADGTIYPNFGGRFGFNAQECAEIVEGASAAMHDIRPIFPIPGGGITLEKMPELLDLYGREVIYLMGGGLHRGPGDVVANCQYFRNLVEMV